MQSVQQTLERALADAIGATVGPDHRAAAQVRACDNPKFGDYQCSSLIGLAKKLGQNPRQLAQQIADTLAASLQTVCEKIETAGAGYINFRLKNSFLGAQTAAALTDAQHGVPAADPPLTIVVDFSSPNIAKPMHVGHIRSTILGDTLARTLRFVGHRVITDNHLGDWGTQFGYLTVGWKKFRDDDALARDPLAECERLYKFVYAKAETDAALKNEVRAELAKLQAGDSENLEIWHRIRDISSADFEKIYQRLGVKSDHAFGESFYNARLPAVVAELHQCGIAQESEGAICVFFDAPNLKDHPMLIQKSDGAFLYGTTDLATIQYRVEQWKPQEILYVTDARQQLHFRQLFAAVKKWGIAPQTKLRHIAFGSILGDDGKPLKTREGEPPKLTDLLDEAERRALAVVQEKNPDLPDDHKREIARVVGLGALKYADLSSNRTTDYTFSWDKMLAMTGNTAPYLQYAYVRTCSIFAKGEVGAVSPTRLEFSHTAELDLAKHLLRFPEAIDLVLEDYRPHFLCGYLYELATKFAAFYEACPVLKADEPARRSRLALCQLSAAVLKRGLDLLGIETIEQM